jgi:hypothetical protein
MAKHIQSGIKCDSMPEVYYVGCKIARREHIERYEGPPLKYDGGRNWYPDFIVDGGTIVEVKSTDSPDEEERLELDRDGESTIQAKFRDNPGVVEWVNGLRYKSAYEDYLAQNLIYKHHDV